MNLLTFVHFMKSLKLLRLKCGSNETVWHIKHVYRCKLAVMLLLSYKDIHPFENYGSPLQKIVSTDNQETRCPITNRNYLLCTRNDTGVTGVRNVLSLHLISWLPSGSVSRKLRKSWKYIIKKNIILSTHSSLCRL